MSSVNIEKYKRINTPRTCWELGICCSDVFGLFVLMVIRAIFDRAAVSVGVGKSSIGKAGNAY
jgi:hypothetical protein